MLNGSLEHFALADIFRLISWAKKTGKIDVARPTGRGKAFFRDGEVYYAESSVSREPLGQKLIRSGMLTEVNLRRALEQNARSGHMIGKILLSNGWVTEHQLQTALKQQIEDCVFDMLSSNEGTFDFTPGVVADIDVQISVSVENLIMESARRLDEMELIRRRIPSLDAVLRMSATPPEGAAEINITAEEWRMLVLVDGQRTVEQIAQAVGKDSFGAMRSLYGLVNSGLIEVVTDAGAALQGDTVDPRISISPEPPHVAPGPLTGPVVEHVEFDEPVGHPQEASVQPSVAATEIEIVGAPTEVPEVSIEPSELAPQAPVGAEALPPLPKGKVLFSDEGPIFEPEESDELEVSGDSMADPTPPSAGPPPVTDDPRVDRSTVVRELAGLFSDDLVARPAAEAVAEGEPESQDNRKRVEDDEAVDQALISKLIDGVKGM